MIIGIPKEIKNQEYRVGATPDNVKILVQAGHAVFVEKNAGVGSGFEDSEYKAAGGEILNTAGEIWGKADMIYKVKEPIAEEYPLLRKNQILFTFLHLAPDEAQTKALVQSKAICVAYETVETKDKKLPLLIPMSEVAGRLAIQEGAKYLEKKYGGRGVLLGGVPGVAPGKVVVVGAGIVGTQAAWMAAGMKADVTIFDINLDRLRYLDDVMPSNVKTRYSSESALLEAYIEADLIIGSVLIPGAKAPKLLTNAHTKLMKKGAVLVDVSIDQGGFAEDSKATTHDDPIYDVNGVVFYCVANMPGAVARTSTQALNNATISYALQLADKGVDAIRESEELKKGLNVYKGHVTYKAVAEAWNFPYVEVDEALKKIL